MLSGLSWKKPRPIRLSGLSGDHQPTTRCAHWLHRGTRTVPVYAVPRLAHDQGFSAVAHRAIHAFAAQDGFQQVAHRRGIGRGGEQRDLPCAFGKYFLLGTHRDRDAINRRSTLPPSNSAVIRRGSPPRDRAPFRGNACRAQAKRLRKTAYFISLIKFLNTAPLNCRRCCANRGHGQSAEDRQQTRDGCQCRPAPILSFCHVRLRFTHSPGLSAAIGRNLKLTKMSGHERKRPFGRRCRLDSMVSESSQTGKHPSTNDKYGARIVLAFAQIQSTRTSPSCDHGATPT